MIAENKNKIPNERRKRQRFRDTANHSAFASRGNRRRSQHQPQIGRFAYTSLKRAQLFDHLSRRQTGVFGDHQIRQRTGEPIYYRS